MEGLLTLQLYRARQCTGPSGVQPARLSLAQHCTQPVYLHTLRFQKGGAYFKEVPILYPLLPADVLDQLAAWLISLPWWASLVKCSADTHGTACCQT